MNEDVRGVSPNTNAPHDDGAKAMKKRWHRNRSVSPVLLTDT